MVLLTKTDPGGELAEGSSVWVVALAVKQFKSHIDEGLQHRHPCFGARFGPLRLSDCSVNLKGSQCFIPVYRLEGEGGGEKKSTNLQQPDVT